MGTDKNTGKSLLWDPYFELLSFLITSARGLVDEPQIYGPLRLLDAAVKLINLMEREGRLTDELREIRQLIREKSNLVMLDEKAFIEFLDELSLKLAKIIKSNLPSPKETK
jgi:hypothetical protein